KKGKPKKRKLVKLFILPVTLALLSIGFGFWQTLLTLHTSDQQHTIDLNLAATQHAADTTRTVDQQQEVALVDYEKDISDLLQNQQLGKSNQEDSVRAIA